MKLLAIIPARFGSKGLKNKNIKLFNKKPLIFWTIKAAQKSKFIKRLIVTTDSTKIKKIAIKYNCEVPFSRKKSLAKSNTLMIDVINDVLLKLDPNKSIYDTVMILQPTSPLRNEKHIDSACRKFYSKNFDSLVSIYKLNHNQNPNEVYELKKNKLKKFINSEKIIPLRQKKKTFYSKNGAAIYITKISKIEKYILGGKIAFFKMNKLSSIDIDDKEDFIIAESIKKNYLN